MKDVTKKKNSNYIIKYYIVTDLKFVHTICDEW